MLIDYRKGIRSKAESERMGSYMKFTKMHGCGNDYIYVNGFKEKIGQDKKPEFLDITVRFFFRHMIPAH